MLYTQHMDGESRKILEAFVADRRAADGADVPPASIELVRAGGLRVTGEGGASVRTRASDTPIADLNFDFQNEYEGQLTIDVYQDGNDIIVESTIAGIDPKDIDIAVTNESVSIRGERRRDVRVDERDFFYRECFWGKFARSVILPQKVDPDRAKATLKNGVLMIRMPKLDGHEAKRLTVHGS